MKFSNSPQPIVGAWERFPRALYGFVALRTGVVRLAAELKAYMLLSGPALRRACPSSSLQTW